MQAAEQAQSGGLDFALSFLPVERKQLGDPVVLVGGQASEDVCEIGKGFDVVEDAGLDQRIGDGRGAAAALGAGEEPVFSADGDRAHGALAQVVVDLEDAVIRIAGERGPVRERVAESAGQRL